MVSKTNLFMIGIVGFIAIFALGLFLGWVGAFAAGLLILSWIITIYFDLYSSGAVRFLGLAIVVVLILGSSVVGSAAGLRISAPSAGSFRIPYLGDIALLFSPDGPKKYVEQRFVEQGERDIQAAASALEVGKIVVAGARGLAGDTVDPSQQFSIVFQINNKGNKPALITEAGISMEAKAFEAGFQVLDRQGQKIGDSFAIREMPNTFVPQGPGSVKSYDVTAPLCGSDKPFKFEAFLAYRYKVASLLPIELINPNYYEQLGRQGKLKFADPATNTCLLQQAEVCVRDGISNSGAGPFKLTIRTTEQQPIKTQELLDTPVGRIASNTTTEIWVGMVNEQKGGALVFDVNVTIPDIFVRDPSRAGACQLQHSPTADNPNLYKPVPVLNAQKENRTVLIPAERKEPEYWKCGFIIDPEKAKAITQTRTMFLTASVDYEYRIAEEKQIKVATVEGQETCEQKRTRLAEIEKKVFDLGLPTNKSAALERITKDMCLMSTYITADVPSGKEGLPISINLAGCDLTANNSITFKEILDLAKANYSRQACATQPDKIKFKSLEAVRAATGIFGLSPLGAQIFGIGDIRDPTFTLEPGVVYQIKPVFWTQWPHGNGVDMQITSIKQDTKECFQPINAACEAASTNSTTCASKNCQSLERWLTSQSGYQHVGVSPSAINQTVTEQIANLTAGGKTADEVIADAPYIKKVLDAFRGDAKPSEAFVCQPSYSTYSLGRGGECKVDVGGGNFQTVSSACEIKGQDLSINTLRWCSSTTLFGRVSSFCTAPCTVNMPITVSALSSSSYPEGTCIYPAYVRPDWPGGLAVALNFTSGLVAQYTTGTPQQATDTPGSMACICPTNDGTGTYKSVNVHYNSTTKQLYCQAPCDTGPSWTAQTQADGKVILQAAATSITCTQAGKTDPACPPATPYCGTDNRCTA